MKKNNEDDYKTEHTLISKTLNGKDYVILPNGDLIIFNPKKKTVVIKRLKSKKPKKRTVKK